MYHDCNCKGQWVGALLSNAGVEVLVASVVEDIVTFCIQLANCYCFEEGLGISVPGFIVMSSMYVFSDLVGIWGLLGFHGSGFGKFGGYKVQVWSFSWGVGDRLRLRVHIGTWGVRGGH